MQEFLVQSIKLLQKSKYGRGNKVRLTSIQSALKQANPLFSSDENKAKTGKIINFRNIEQTEHIPRILEEFADNFRTSCLENAGGSFAKNYSLFSVTLLKIIKTLDADKKRGLLSAHAINLLNQMFVKYPIKYKKAETREPLKFVFVVIELVIDAERNLSKNYEFDEILLRQISPLIQRYYMRYDDTLQQIITELGKMSKFRLTVSIQERHGEIVQTFLQYAMGALSQSDKIKRAESIIEKITGEQDDSVILQYYNVLKLCFDDKEVVPHLVQIVKEKKDTKRRFAATILDEISNL